jgi:hypothetical protein
MIDTRQTARRLTFGMPALAVFTLLYLVSIFWLPASHNTLQLYNLSSANYHVLLLIIALPLLIIWLGAFLSYSLLRAYARSVRRTAEGVHYDQLARGAAWLAWSLPISTLSSMWLNAIANKSPGFHPAAIIIANYINLVLPLVAFTLINDAARGLFNHAKLSYRLGSSRALTLFFAVAGVLYCYLTFRHFDLSSLASSHNPYFLPVWLMVLTVTIPYLYTWFVGTMAAYEIMLFSRKVRGVFYRQALHLMAIGLITVIASFIAQQYLNSVVPRVGYLVLDYRLALILVLRVITGIGFAMIAMGAIRLKKIEEV